ncbi:MAG TPA: hypothetical protein VGC41_06400 [Kofleriaceae bacterium]
MAKKLWSPVVAAVAWVMLALLVGCVIGGAFADTSNAYESGRKLGRALAPAVIAVGVIAYFVQGRRVSNKS